jgi:hypothetical protein
MSKLTLRIGRRHKIEVADLEEASRVYQRLRDDSGEGYSTFPDGRVSPGNYHVSYNGRVWLSEKLLLEAAKEEVA